MIRIEDTRSGSEGYTFDIEWSGASGGYASDGFTTSTYPVAATSPTTGTGGILSSRRAATRSISAERALDLCRAEVHARGERDYDLRNIDITAVGVDTSQGRSNRVTGTFTDSSGTFLRGSGYRFNCAVDYSSGQVGTVEILRADGSAVQPGAASGAYNSGSAYGTTSYNQTQVLRACQDAVVARVDQAGYQNVQFGSMGNRRSAIGVGIRHRHRQPCAGDRHLRLQLFHGLQRGPGCQCASESPVRDLRGNDTEAAAIADCEEQRKSGFPLVS